MADKTFGGCNVEPGTEALERQVAGESPSIPPLPTSSEVETARRQCREAIEEGRGIF